MGEQRRTRGRVVPMAIGAALLLVAIGLIALFMGEGGGPAPGPPPTATPTPWKESEPPTEETYPAAPEPVLETTEGTHVTEKGVLGEVEVEYPVHMSPGSSGLLILSIYIPPELASLAPVSIERVEIPPDAPDIVGKHETHHSTILVAGTMRVELSSPTFVVDPLYPALREVDIRHVNVATVWAWDIAAPNVPGLHVLTARVYLGEQDAPIWVRGFEVEVIELTPTPQPTPRPTVTPLPTATPRPALQRFAAGVADNAALVAILLVVVVGLAAGAIVFLRKRKGEAGRDRIVGGEQPYNLAAVRELLQAAFTAETLRRFCQDRPAFRPVVAKFGPGQGLDDMVDRVIDYCETQLLWEEFLAEVEKENPRQYSRYAPELRQS